MPLSATSTYSEIATAYVGNQHYAVQGSQTMAQDFVDACAWLLVKPTRSEDRDGEFEFDHSMIREQMRTAQDWLLTNFGVTPVGAKPQVTFATFSDFR